MIYLRSKIFVYFFQIFRISYSYQELFNFIHSLIRLEFSDYNQEYYTELDAVEIFGYTNEYFFETETISKGLKDICLKYKEFFRKDTSCKEDIDTNESKTDNGTKSITETNTSLKYTSSRNHLASIPVVLLNNLQKFSLTCYIPIEKIFVSKNGTNIDLD
jgi:hypothetical protein